jgi:hypothetical protein
MLWSAADVREPRVANLARHDLIVVGIGTVGLRWTPHEFPAMSETIDPRSVAPARAYLKRIRARNPAAVVLCDVNFFEERKNGYPPDHAWWLRDRKGRKKTFWPGTWRMDLANAAYVSHVARRIAAVHEAGGGRVGVFLDNFRHDGPGVAAWRSLLGHVRLACGAKMPIVINAGRPGPALAHVASLINGAMYEDSVSHAPAGDTEAFYARIAAMDRLLTRPRISINEVFGKRSDRKRMVRELARTLVYTDMHFLYSDSTHGHRHAWYGLWDAPLGRAAGPPAVPHKGRLARREFAGGIVLWLPDSATGKETVGLERPMTDALTGKKVSAVALEPGSGSILLRAEGTGAPGPAAETRRADEAP